MRLPHFSSDSQTDFRFVFKKAPNRDFSEGGSFSVYKKDFVDREKIELTDIKKTSERSAETRKQNKIRDALKNEIETKTPTSLLETKIKVGKRDTLAALAFSVDKLATAKWKTENPNKKVNHSAKELNIDWKTKVVFIDKDNKESSQGDGTLRNASPIKPGQVVSFRKLVDGKTEIVVSDEVIGKPVTPLDETHDPQTKITPGKPVTPLDETHDPQTKITPGKPIPC